LVSFNRKSPSLIIPSASDKKLISRSYFLPDPTALETPLLPTTVVIALDEKDKACLVRQDGMGGLKEKGGEDILGEAWKAAAKRARELRSILDESCQ
jgi:exosome complex RNA-binding protein Rrp42 (RNase PH superfamily)